jgi:MFS family permease
MALGLTTVAATPTIAQTALGLALTGLGIGTFTTFGQDFVAGAASAAFRGLAVATLVSTIRLAQAVSPSVVSLMTDRVSARAVFIAAAVLVALVATTWRPFRALVNKRKN